MCNKCNQTEKTMENVLLLQKPLMNGEPSNVNQVMHAVANLVSSKHPQEATHETTHETSETKPKKKNKSNVVRDVENNAHARTKSQRGVVRRKKLWELPVETYCTLLGTCFTMRRLRQLVAKKHKQKYKNNNGSMQDLNRYSDYDLHVDSCHFSRTKNPLSIELQKDMDTRYAQEVSHCKKHVGEDELMETWRQALATGEVAGYIWALLTHPYNTAALTDQICKDMHMLQHYIEPSARVEKDKNSEKWQALEQENHALAQTLADAQRRSTANVRKHQRTTEKLRTEMMKLRGQAMQKDSLIAFLQEDVERLMNDSESGTSVQRKLEKALVRERALEQRIKTYKRTMQNAEKRIKKLEFSMQNHALLQEASQKENQQSGAYALASNSNGDVEHPMFFAPKSKVLCVGGKSKKIPEYKNILERTGADFLHHDGGLENNQAQLDAALAASDVVICQTGCISHNAYWRVKNHCKRTGKQCIYVDNPSTSSLLASLQKVQQRGQTSADQELSEVV